MPVAHLVRGPLCVDLVWKDDRRDRVFRAADWDFFQLARADAAEITRDARGRAGRVRRRFRPVLPSFDGERAAADSRHLDRLFADVHRERCAAVGEVGRRGQRHGRVGGADRRGQRRAGLGEDRDDAPVVRPGDPARAVGARDDLVEPRAAAP